MEFLEGTGSGLLEGKTMLMLGGWPADYFYTVSDLSRLLGNRGLAHEICRVFQVSNWLAY